MHRKKIIIIGASSGMGREIAGIYASRGHSVVITARRAELLHEVKKLYPNNIITAHFDVLQNNQKLAEIIQQLGGLDLLIYCAGFGEPSSVFDPVCEDLTTRTNVNGFVSVAGQAFQFFLQQGFGQIALISSVAAVRGNSWAPAYSASKAFMSSYAESLNLQAWRLKKQIVVTDIRPGFVNTKESKGNRRFWVAPVHKAATQIVHAIDRKKRVVYITKRWWLVARLMRLLPFPIYRRLV